MLINISRVSDIVIKDNTPLDVIIFLLNTTGKNIDKEKIEKKYEKIKKHIEEYSVEFEEKEDYGQEEILKLTCFVTDSEEPWSVENLISSVRNILQFQKSPSLEIEKIGSRNNTSPFSFDICMLYRLCLELSLETSREDTIETLYEKVKNVIRPKEELIEEVKNKLLHFDQFQLIKINKNKTDQKDFKFEISSLDNLSKSITTSYIITHSILSNEQSMIYAFKFYNLDITESSHPDVLLKCLSGEKIEEYPFEDTFKKKNTINPLFYKLDKFWKPEFKEMYSPKALQNIKKYFDVETEEELNKSLEEDNFYEGGLDFNEEDTEKDIVSYGKYHEFNFEKIKISHLVQKFNDELVFGKYKNSIEKLLNIARNNFYEDLERVIKYIKKYCHIITSSILYCKKNNNDKLKLFFESVFQLSEILKDKKEISEMDNLSFISTLDEIIKIFNSFPEEMKREIEKLPILNYKNGKFSKSNENYYENLYEDLKSLKNIKGKSEEFIRMKYCQYSYSSYYYILLFFDKKIIEVL